MPGGKERKKKVFRFLELAFVLSLLNSLISTFSHHDIRSYQLSLQEHVSFIGMFDRDQACFQMKFVCFPSSMLAYLPRLPLSMVSSKEVFPCLFGYELCIPFQNCQQSFQSKWGRMDFYSYLPEKFFRSTKYSLLLRNI